MAKSKKTFKPVRLESTGGTPIRGAVFNKEYNEAQKEARRRYQKAKARKQKAIIFAAIGRPRLKKTTD